MEKETFGVLRGVKHKLNWLQTARFGCGLNHLLTELTLAQRLVGLVGPGQDAADPDTEHG